MLNNLTIVIITFKRYGFLKRQLNFYLSYKSQAKILILDSTPYDPEDKELQFLLLHENVKWKKYDQSTFFPEKIALGCRYIDTEYAVLSTDDDFLILTSLELCTDFLEKHSKYSSAHGLYFTHRLDRGFVRKNFWLDPLYSGMASSLEEKTGTNRIIRYLNGNSPYYPMYAVHSTNIFRLIWQETTKHVKHQGLSEVFPACMSFIYGQMKVLPVFYCSREANNYIGWYNQEDLKVVYSEEKVTIAVNGLAQHLVKLDCLQLENAKSQLQDAFKIYVGSQFSKIDKKILRNPSLFFSYFEKIRVKIRFRSRLYNWFYSVFYQGCPPIIYRNNITDYKRVNKFVLSYGLGFDELNEARKQIYYPSTSSEQNQNEK